MEQPKTSGAARISSAANLLASKLPFETLLYVHRFLGPRCQLCDEGIGVPCRTADWIIELWCLDCFTGMLPDTSSQFLVDGIVRGKHSYTACTPSERSLLADFSDLYG